MNTGYTTRTRRTVHYSLLEALFVRRDVLSFHQKVVRFEETEENRKKKEKKKVFL